jgi:protoporphyrinogen oxidase
VTSGSRGSKARVLILGAGCTGLGAAWRLHELGHTDFLVLEKEAWPGGLSASFVDPAGFTWDIGGHVLFSRSEYFNRALDEAMAGQWIEHARQSHIWTSGRFVPYPFQYNLRHLPKEQILECLHGLLEAGRNGKGEIRSFRDWISASFGSGIARLFMLPYNFKVWAHPAELMSSNWVGERVATVDLARALDNVILERDDISWGPNNTFRFPKAGGTGAIWRAVAGCLPQDRLRFSEEVCEIDLDGHRVRTSRGWVPYDALISSLPLDLVARMTGRDSLLLAAGRLRYTTTHVVGIGLRGAVPEHLAEKNWMYFPEPDNPFYRVTVFSNYSPANVPAGGRTWSLMAEVSESAFKPLPEGDLVASVVGGMRNTGLIPEHPDIASVWTYRAERGYPVPTRDRGEYLKPVIEELERHSVYSRGRFGAWKYEAGNQDHSFIQGVEAADDIYGVGHAGRE